MSEDEELKNDGDEPRKGDSNYTEEGHLEEIPLPNEPQKSPEKTESKKQKGKNIFVEAFENPNVRSLAVAISVFIAGLGVGSFTQSKYLNKDLVNKSNCDEYTSKLPDVIMLQDLNEKQNKELVGQLDNILNAYPVTSPIENPDFTPANVNVEIELDIITGQLMLMRKLIKGQNPQAAMDSLENGLEYRKKIFDQKYK